MHWIKLLSILFLILTNWSYASEVDENFQIPVWTSSKNHYMKRNDILISESSYQNDTDSGCCCRETTTTITCFGSIKCVKFPKNVNIQVANMKLRNTNIRRLKSGDLNNTLHLTYLEIEANYNLERIGNGSFIGMNNLRNLSISFNPKLTTFEVNCFEGLVNLVELILIKNGLTKLLQITYTLLPLRLPKLTILKLNENTFTEIYENDFKPMYDSTITELGLVLCQIEYIHPASLAPLKYLKTLRLGENIFNSSVITDLIRKTTELNIPLQRLNLYSMGLKKNPPRNLMNAIAKSNITVLNLSRNQFELLKNDSFPYMPNLIQLDLRDILAVNINLDTFKVMPNLKILLLSKNKLITVPYGVLLPQLTYLDLSTNSNMHTPSYFNLEKNKFENMSNLWGLNLSYNNIHVLFNYSFVGLSNLKVLGLKESSIYFIGDGTFLPLRNLIFLDLDNNPFPDTSHHFNKNIFYGLDKLKILLLNRCSINVLEHDIFVNLKSLEHLSLIDNHVTTITPQLFYPLKNLIKINLDDNLLTTWTVRMFNANKKLNEITLSHNKITGITDAMVNDIYKLVNVDLSKNPISCNCILYNTINGNGKRRNNNKLIDLLDQEVTYCAYPDEYAHLTVAKYYNVALNNNLCPYLFDRITLVILPIIIFIIIIFITMILIWKYRWYIRYWFFLTKIELIKRCNITMKRKNENVRYEYDAFVSYSNEDRNFIVRLVAMLENYEPFFKLCVYERDFQIGSIITESVLQSVAKSRKTLLIISNSYVKSQWCQWEAQVAEHHRLFFENEFGDLVNDSIVIIKLGDVSSSNMTPMLKYLMKTRIYLQWDSNVDTQKIFWEKLRKTLAPPIITQIVTTQNET